jgi:hypothetical protein
LKRFRVDGSSRATAWASLRRGIHPAQVRRLSHDLQVAVYNAVISARWNTRDLLHDKQDRDYYERVKSDPAKAEGLRQALMEKARPT